MRYLTLAVVMLFASVTNFPRAEELPTPADSVNAAAEPQEPVAAAAAPDKAAPGSPVEPSRPAEVQPQAELSAAAETARPAEVKSQPLSAAEQDAGLEAKIKAEWEFLKKNGDTISAEAASAVLSQLAALLRFRPDAEFSDEGRLLKSALHMRLGDHRSAVTDLLALIYEFPDSKFNLHAKRTYTDIVEKKMERKAKPALMDAIKVPDQNEKPRRLAEMLKRLGGMGVESLYEPTAAEYDDFFFRYPLYAGSDELQMLLGDLHLKNGKYITAMLAYWKLLALYPSSAFRAKAQRLTGDIYANNLRDADKAAEAYQRVINDYSSSDEAGTAYGRMAKLEEQQKRYALAVDIYEKVIKLYPGREAALSAFREEARLLKDVMDKPAEAIKVYARLADMYKGAPAAEEALKTAAETAYDIKDYSQAVELYQRLASDAPESAGTPESLFSAAQICERELANLDKAVEIYNSVSSKYPVHKLAKKAKSRVESITKK